MPDYEAIAIRLYANNCTPASIASALRAAYAKGQTAALRPEDVGTVVCGRLQRHVADIDALTTRLSALVADIKAPRE